MSIPALAPLILLVDDFEDARDIYHEYLMFRGYRVVLAEDGRGAVEQAQLNQPDLILLDLRMPNLTGAEALIELKADPALRGVPVVAFTAHALDAEREHALALGFDAVLAKPCLPDDLVTFIERMLDRPAV